jgi:hypothetical protein
MPESRDISSSADRWWLLCGLVAELAAFAALGTEALPAAIALHVVSALAFGVWAADGEIMSRPAACAVACVVVLTMPALGALGVCLVLVPAWRGRRPATDEGVIELELPSSRHVEYADVTLAAGVAVAVDVDTEERRSSQPAATTPIEVVLQSGVARKRVAAVMALRRMDAQRAVPLLRVALGDPSEDVRLLAYALLERREKDLRGDIERLHAELAAVSGDAVLRAQLLRRLTEQHWELVHGAFVSGDLEAHTLRAAIALGHESLLLAPDGSLALLLARIRLRSGNAHAALRYLRAAAALGVASAVIAPLYAEVAFRLGRFSAIQPLLAQAGEVALARPRLAAVATFWRGRAAL